MISVASQLNSGASLDSCDDIACQQVSATAMIRSLSHSVNDPVPKCHSDDLLSKTIYFLV